MEQPCLGAGFAALASDERTVFTICDCLYLGVPV